jgi:hypothetical protein
MSAMLTQQDNTALVTVAGDTAGPGATINIQEARPRGQASKKPPRERKGPGGSQTEKAKRWTAGRNNPRSTDNTGEAPQDTESGGIHTDVEAELQSLQLTLDMATGPHSDVLGTFTKELKDADPAMFHILRQPLPGSFQFFVKKSWKPDIAIKLLESRIAEINDVLSLYAPVLREKKAKLEERRQEEEFEPMWLELLQRRLLRKAAELGKESHFTDWLRQQDASAFNALTKPVGDSVEYLLNRYENMNEWRALRSVRLALTRVQEEYLPAFQAELQELQEGWDKTHELVTEYEVVVKPKIKGLTAQLFNAESMMDALKHFRPEDVERTLTFVNGLLEGSTSDFINTQGRKGRKKGKTRGQIEREEREAAKRAALPARSKDTAGFKSSGGNKK